MANKQNKADFASGPELLSMETPGRAMTETDFLRAVASFTGAPMHARQRKGV